MAPPGQFCRTNVLKCKPKFETVNGLHHSKRGFCAARRKARTEKRTRPFLDAATNDVEVPLGTARTLVILALLYGPGAFWFLACLSPKNGGMAMKALCSISCCLGPLAYPAAVWFFIKVYRAAQAKAGAV